MELNRPTPHQAFKNHPLNSGNKVSYKDKLESSIQNKRYARENTDSYHSFAPDNTYIIKRNYRNGGILIIISLILIALFIYGLLKFGIQLILLFALLTGIGIFISSAVLIYKSILNDRNPEENVKALLSNKGIKLGEVFYPWTLITNERIIRKGNYYKRRYFLSFNVRNKAAYITFSLSEFEVDFDELKYLLHIYRSRSKDRFINQNSRYERKYLSLSEKRKQLYILG